MTTSFFNPSRAGAAFAVAALLLGACSSDASGPDASSARLRLVNGSSASVDLLADGQVVASGVGASTASPFTTLPSGSHQLTLQVGGETRGQLSAVLDDSTDYSVVAGGGDNSLSAVVQPDTALSDPGTSLEGKIKLWVVYADSSGRAAPLDVYLTAPDADLATATPLGNSIDFGFVPLDPGIYEVRFTESGTTHVVLDSVPVVLDPDVVESLILTQSTTGPSVNLIAR